MKTSIPSICLAIALVSPAQGGLVAANFDSENNGDYSVYLNNYTACALILDKTFEVSMLDSVSILSGGGLNQTSLLALSIYSNAEGDQLDTPGSLIADCGTNVVDDYSIYSFSPTTPLLLEPDTTYWIVVRALTHWGMWGCTLDDSLDAGSNPAAQLRYNARTLNNGHTWHVDPNDPLAMLAVYATPIPSPSGLVLLAGMTLFLGRRRRSDTRGRIPSHRQECVRESLL